MKISDERWEEIHAINEAADNAYAYMWGVMRDADNYASTVKGKWQNTRLQKYFRDFCERRRHFDDDLEIFLTKEDKKQIHGIIKKRLEQLITMQQELTLD